MEVFSQRSMGIWKPSNGFDLTIASGLIMFVGLLLCCCCWRPFAYLAPVHGTRTPLTITTQARMMSHSSRYTLSPEKHRLTRILAKHCYWRRMHLYSSSWESIKGKGSVQSAGENRRSQNRPGRHLSIQSLDPLQLGSDPRCLIIVHTINPRCHINVHAPIPTPSTVPRAGRRLRPDPLQDVKLTTASSVAT